MGDNGKKTPDINKKLRRYTSTLCMLHTKPLKTRSHQMVRLLENYVSKK